MTREPSTLADQVALLVWRGILDPFDPAYDVALTAIAVGYSGLTRAQRNLYDRVVSPALDQLFSTNATPITPYLPPWKPIWEAPRKKTIVQLAVVVDGAISAVTFPCRRHGATWVDNATDKTVYVRPTHWREWPGDVSSD